MFALKYDFLVTAEQTLKRIPLEHSHADKPATGVAGRASPQAQLFCPPAARSCYSAFLEGRVENLDRCGNACRKAIPAPFARSLIVTVAKLLQCPH